MKIVDIRWPKSEIKIEFEAEEDVVLRRGDYLTLFVPMTHRFEPSAAWRGGVTLSKRVTSVRSSDRRLGGERRERAMWALFRERRVCGDRRG